MKRWVLLSLLQCGDQPMPERALISAVRVAASGNPTDSDILADVRSAEADGYVTGTEVDVLGRFWMLTTKGKFKARQLQ